MNRILFIVLLSLTAATAVLAQPVPGDLPWFIPYQARFEDAQGNPMPAGNYDMIFGFWDGEFVGGPPFWSEGHQVMVDADGLFEVNLGRFEEINPQNWPDDLEIWLGIGYNEEFLTPRVPLRAVPFAFYADRALKADDADLLEGWTREQLSHRRRILVESWRNPNPLAIFPDQTHEIISWPYVLDFNTFVEVWAFVGMQTDAEFAPGYGTIRVELLDQFFTPVYSSLVMASANPGSLSATGYLDDVPAGTYYVKAYITNTEEVTYDGFDVGLQWQGENILPR